MKKALLLLAALVMLSPVVSSTAFAASRGSLTVAATFGNLPVYVPVVRHSPPPRVIVVNEIRHERTHEKKYRHGKRHHQRDPHECNTRDGRYRQRHLEPTVVYYYPEYRDSRGYRY